MSRIGRIGDWNNNPAGNSGSSSRSGSSRRIATFNDLASGAGGGGSAAHGHDDDSDEEQDPRDRGQEYFAGGERSGVAIQNPDRDGEGGGSNNIIRDLLEQARQGGVYQPPEPASSRFFSGGGHVLGSDEVDSRYIPDASPANNEEEEVVRHLYLWRNGFSVEDGELMSYTEDRDTLELIRSGRAPPAIMNVAINQPVQLIIAQRQHEDYIPPKRGPFHGSGNRLGAPTPSEPSSASIPGAFPTTPAASASTPQVDPERLTTRFEVDQSKPMTSVQIRLADGTRLVARVNLTHTVGDLRNFINASRPGTGARAYNMVTPVPHRVLDQDAQTIEEAGLKNSVVVQRWADV